MVRHLMAMNGARKGNKGMARTVELADYDKLIREPWLTELVEDIRKGNGKGKEELPFRCAHYFKFKNSRRRQNAILPEAFTFQTTVDVDEPEYVEEAIRKARLLDAEAGKWQGKLLHIEYSARHKLHIDVRLPLGMTIEETQREYSEAIGVPYDASCITPERFIYITPASEEVYRSEHWYEPLSDGDRKRYCEAFSTRGLSVDGRKELKELKEQSSRSARSSQSSLSPQNSRANQESRSTQSSQSTRRAQSNQSTSSALSKSLQIFDLCRREAGLGDVDINQIGSRHTALQSIMSVGASRLMDEEELKAVVAVRMAEYYSEDDCQQLIHDFYAKYHDDSKVFNSTVQRILAEAERLTRQKQSCEEQDKDQEEQTPAPSSTLPAEAARVLRRLPIGLKESLIGVPPMMQLPVLCAVMPIAAAYADGVEVEYCDGNRQRLGLMSIIVGDQASGKSVCKNVVDVWKQQLDAEDAVMRKREDEWKEARKRRKANEKAPEDPKVTIRVLPVTVSCSTLLKRFKNAGDHTEYSFGEELDTLRKTNGAGSWSSKYDIYRLSFDHGEWGQDYNSDQAESGTVKVAYNWTMLGTYGALHRCFQSDNIENGLSSRVLVAEMPDNSFAKMPHYDHRSEEDEQRIDEAVNKLRSCKGFVNTPQLRKAINEWVEAKRVEAAKDIDYVKDTYRKRAAVIGFRCGVIAHLLSGKENELKSVLNFAKLMAQYALDEQTNIFGKSLLYQLAKDKDEDSHFTENQSVFDQLPSTFKLTDLMKLKGGEGSNSRLRTIIYRWKKDGWIEKAGVQMWKKVTRCHSVTCHNKGVED